ncbi:MAG: hypothetical protein U0235_06285 [Polyangiaceae bacterium]
MSSFGRLGLISGILVLYGCGSGQGASVDTGSQGWGGEVPSAHEDDGKRCKVKAPSGECDDDDDHHDAAPPPAADGGVCDPPSQGDAGSDAAPPPPPPPPPPASCSFTDYSDGLVGGQINDVAYDARVPGLAFAAAGGRLFKSTDGGATWALLYEGAEFGFRKLALPPGAPNVLYAASSDGVVRSDDGGAHWSSLALAGLSISTLVVHPKQPLRMYAAVRGAGVIRSNDGGETWGSIDNGIPYGEFNAITVDPDAIDTVMVSETTIDASYGASGGILWRSTNAGLAWTKVIDNPKGYIPEVAYCASNPDVMIAANYNYYGGMGGVARSTDRGVTWTLTGGLDHKIVTDVAMAPSDCNTIYAVDYANGLRRSTDGGVTFSGYLTNGIPFVNHFPRHVAVDPASTTRFIGSSHAGVLYSNDAGDHFAVVGGVMNLGIRSLAVSPTDPTRLWMATWGSGVWSRASAATPWSKNGLALDYAFVAAPDPSVANRVFVGGWSYPFMSTDGVTFNMQSVPKNPFAFAFDPTAPDTVYMATQISGLYKTTTAGATWATANGTLTAWDVGGSMFIDTRAVLVDRTNPTHVLVATNGRGIYRSDDGGVTLGQVAPTLANKLVSCLVQTTDGAIFACVDGSGIAKSTDGGTTFDFVNVGLTSLNVGSMVADGNDVYSTSNLGVFKTTSATSGWMPIDTTCLPVGGAGSVAVLGGASKTLVVGTGRGVFAKAL